MRSEYRNVTVEVFEDTQQVHISVDDNKTYSFPIGSAENICTALTEVLRLRTRKMAFEGNLVDAGDCRYIVTEFEAGWISETSFVELIDTEDYSTIVSGKLLWSSTKNTWFIRQYNDEDYYFTIEEMDNIEL
jgi:hypothetical protein